MFLLLSITLSLALASEPDTSGQSETTDHAGTYGHPGKTGHSSMDEQDCHYLIQGDGTSKKVCSKDDDK